MKKFNSEMSERNPKNIKCRRKPDVICNSDYVDCEKVIRWLDDFSFSCAEIFIEDSEKLIERFDEEVEYDFMEEGYLAKTRNIDTPEIAQILVAPDLIHQKDSLDVEDQVIISALHENAHIIGIDDEEDAEQFAYKEYKENSKSYVPRLTRRC